MDPAPPSLVPTPSLRGARVLLTGAAGFIGRVLAERLCAEGAEVRGLVRTVSGAIPLARLPVEVVVGDVADAARVREAVDGCDIVVNLTKGKSRFVQERWAVDVGGARNLVTAAHDAGVHRYVQLSSLLAYGLPPDGDLDERTPKRPTTDVYGTAKRRADALVLGYGRETGVPVTVLQPTAVYGPGGSVWSEGVLRMMLNGRVVLVDGGRGLSNAVYVDDLVNAIVRVSIADRAVGEEFLISGPAPFPWRVFYERFEKMVGGSRLVAMSATEARDLWLSLWKQRPGLGAEVRRLLLGAGARERLMSSRSGSLVQYGMQYLPPAAVRLVKKAVVRDDMPSYARPAAAGPGLAPILPWGPFMIKFLSRQHHVRTDKARRLLGWEPVVEFEDGAARTEEWARWAGLVPDVRRSWVSS